MNKQIKKQKRLNSLRTALIKNITRRKQCIQERNKTNVNFRDIVRINDGNE